MTRPKPAIPSSGNGPRKPDVPGKRPRGSNGQGANSALAEMLRRQAQNPRPGVPPQQRHEVRDAREPRPVAPRTPH
jgi:hypothetical protein